MKGFMQLNHAATMVFCELIDRLHYLAEYFDCVHVKMENDPYMNLVFEQIGGPIETLMGKGFLYALAHTFIQEGDRMCDPEMTFLVIDKRSEPTDYSAIAILAASYQQDKLGLYQNCLTIENDRLTKYNSLLHHKLTSFANGWMRNIQAQGFLRTPWSKEDSLHRSE